MTVNNVNNNGENLGRATALMGLGGSAAVKGVSLSLSSIPFFIPALIAHLALPALGVSASLTGIIVTIAAIIPSVMVIASIAAVVLGTAALSIGACLGCFACCML